MFSDNSDEEPGFYVPELILTDVFQNKETELFIIL